MADLLPAVGVISYNGVTFGARVETKSVEIVPVLDSARRTVVYDQYSLTIDTDLYAPEDSTDDDMALLRAQLTAVGGKLVYTGKGLGNNITINPQDGDPVAPNSFRDVKWGPIPKVLTWKPVGNNIYVHLTWKIDWAVQDCPNPIQKLYNILEYCYKLTFDIDKSGYTKRIFTGHAIIPQTRTKVTARGLRATADQLRDNASFLPPLIPGYRRTMGPWPSDESKCRIDFNIVDEQMPPNVPPEGIIEVSCDQSVVNKSMPFGGGTLWSETLNATYEVALDTPTVKAKQYFDELLQDRKSYSSTAIDKQGKKVPSILRSYSMRRGLYSRGSVSLSASWTHLAPLGEIVFASGMFQPVPNSDWEKWSTSMSNTAFNARGASRLKLLPSDDLIIDLCYQGNNSVLRAAPTPTNTNTLKTRPGVMNEVPSPEFSWLAWQSAITIEQIDDVVALRTLPADSQDPGDEPADDGSSDFRQAPTDPVEILQTIGGSVGRVPGGMISAILENNQSGTALSYSGGDLPTINAYSGGDPNITVQYRNTPRFTAWLTGYAMRAGYGILPPSLISAGGIDALPANVEGCGYSQWTWKSWLGVPIIIGVWRWRYILPGIPDGVIPIMDGPYPLGS